VTLPSFAAEGCVAVLQRCCFWPPGAQQQTRTGGVRRVNDRRDGQTDARPLYTIRDAILTSARKPTYVSLIYRTQPTTKKCQTEKLKSKKTDMLRSNSKQSGESM